MKDYLQPAATCLALAIASLPFALPIGAKASGGEVWTDQRFPLHVKVVVVP